MALHTKQQFAELAGQNEKYLNVYLSRKKIVQREDKLFDDQNDLNNVFLMKRQGKEKKVSSGKAEKETKKTKSDVKEKPAKGKVKSVDENYIAPGSLAYIEKQQKIQQLKKTELEVSLKEIDKKKKMGELIPVDLVGSVFTINNKSILDNFHNAAENLSSVILKRIGANRTDRAEFKAELVKAINKAVEDASEQSKREVKNIVSQFRATKERGERQR